MAVKKGPETLEGIEALPTEMLIATDVSNYLHCNPGNITWQAKHDPDKLGFPVIVAKSRVKIPKVGFVNYCRRGRPVKLDYELMSDRTTAKIALRLPEILEIILSNSEGRVKSPCSDTSST